MPPPHRRLRWRTETKAQRGRASPLLRRFAFQQRPHLIAHPALNGSHHLTQTPSLFTFLVESGGNTLRRLAAPDTCLEDHRLVFESPHDSLPLNLELVYFHVERRRQGLAGLERGDAVGFDPLDRPEVESG